MGQIPADLEPQYFVMKLFRQEYWSVLPFPTPGFLPGLGIEPISLVPTAFAGKFLTASATCEAPL